MKVVIFSMALGGLLSACGGAPDELVDGTADQALGTAEQAVCESWEEGGRYCTYKCDPGDPYRFAAYGSVPYGECREYARSRCGHEAYSVCWSRL
ncbi:hypothetical protein [Pyxidicoccus xibeiensis]|uniref:hypothetical protein n=1 Tax=Pyxidicoccus xibeiensis TaxID=2906759 RepID=UPI0020A82823|nr:hypothetical protein [Pyxidicoccus xibeiensis]MCP3135957.1 hypothetical protein [Pyxidicoccus xibeiensis]